MMMETTMTPRTTTMMQRRSQRREANPGDRPRKIAPTESARLPEISRTGAAVERTASSHRRHRKQRVLATSRTKRDAVG